MKRIYFLILLLAASFSAAQNFCPTGTYPVPNDTSTGTTLNKTAKLNSGGTGFLVMTTSDTAGYAGVVVAGAGTSGTACLASSGIWPVVVDATTTADHYVTISSTTNGDAKDSGATTYPTSGAVLGRVQTPSSGAASVSLIDLFPPEIQASSGGGSSSVGTVTYTSNQTAGSSDNLKEVIMNCSSACAYTFPTTQPATTWSVWVKSVGSTLATVVFNGGDTFNGSTSVPLLVAFQEMHVWSNTAISTDYQGSAPIVAGGGIGLGTSSNSLTISANSSGNSNSSAATNFGSNLTAVPIDAEEFHVEATLKFQVYQKTLGVGCSAGSNTVSITASYTDPNGVVQTPTVPLFSNSGTAGTTLAVSANGSVSASAGNLASGQVIISENNSGATVSFSTTSALASTGCGTVPQYVVTYAWVAP